MWEAKSELAERVQAGVELLNAKSPGWQETIDLDTFYIGNWRHCILGQLGAKEIPDDDHLTDWYYYTCGLKDVGIDSSDAWRYGFELREDEVESLDRYDLWWALHRAWVDVLKV